MRNTAKNAKTALSLPQYCWYIIDVFSAFAADVAEGYKLITDRKKGNCVACHAIRCTRWSKTIKQVMLVHHFTFLMLMAKSL
jgi:hypothetical protein